MGTALPQPHWANAHRVTPSLLVGGSLGSGLGDPAQALRELVSQGLTHILDCRSESSEARLIARYAPQVVYGRVGTTDSPTLTTDGWFESGVGFVRQAFASDPAAVVLTHCALGQTRGPSMGFAVLLDQGYEAGAAFHLIVTARPQARINYAEAALKWHLARTDADEESARRAHASLATARREALGRRRFSWH